jgi:hypothetical protein
VEQQFPIDQSIRFYVSGLSREQSDLWLFETERNRRENVGHNTDKAKTQKE